MSKLPWRAGRDIAALAENIEIGTGQRGDGRFAFVTRQDLTGLKLAKPASAGSAGGGKYLLVPAPPPFASPSEGRKERIEYPGAPQNLYASGGFSSVLLEWSMPRYQGHALTEIWRHTEDDLADAVMVATTPGNVYGDPVDPGWKGYYWIRFVNSADDKGAWNAAAGTYAETHPAVGGVIDVIRDQINESPLITKLTTRINDTRTQLTHQLGAVSTNLNTKITFSIADLNNQIASVSTSLSTKVNEIKTQLTDQIASVSTSLTTEVNDAKDRASAMWSVKATAGEITAGIGLVARDGITEVGLAADRVFIFDPNRPDDRGRYAIPFMVSNGKVVMDEALIRDATVKTLKAQTIVADAVKAGVSITTPRLVSATIENGRFSVDSEGVMRARDAQLINLEANRGNLRNMRIREDCVIEGQLSSDNIVGDVAKAYFVDGFSVYIKPLPFDRVITTEGFSHKSEVPKSRIRYGRQNYFGYQIISTIMEIDGVRVPPLSSGAAGGGDRGMMCAYPLRANKGVSVFVYTGILLGDDHLSDSMDAQFTPVLSAPDSRTGRVLSKGSPRGDEGKGVGYWGDPYIVHVLRANLSRLSQYVEKVEILMSGYKPYPKKGGGREFGTKR